MPLYEYFCEACDHVFTDLKPMADHREPSDCPVCGESAPRIVASAPRLNTMRGDLRRAHQTNERSAHEPRMSHGHTCGAGCSHHHHKPKAAEKPAEKPAMKHQAGKRPWMLGH